MKHWAITASILIGCTACAKHYPPAIPAEQVLFEDRSEYAIPAGDAITTGSPVVAPAHHMAVLPVLEPDLIPDPKEWLKFQQVQHPKKADPPKKTVDEANTTARMGPSKKGYSNGASAMQRYPLRPGVVFDVYSAPEHPTTLLLPHGERLAAPPTLNPEAWTVGMAEVGSGPQRQEVIIVRPMAASLEATTPLLLQSGKIIFLRLRSFDKTSMISVAWDLPMPILAAGPAMPAKESAKPVGAKAFPPPQIDVSRLHLAYTIEPGKQVPPWLPVAVYDDSQTTVLKFREPLSYTAAPAVFVQHADGKPGVVQFTEYHLPGEPEKGAFYLVSGLWPVLELRGTDSMAVKITRISPQPKSYQEVRR